MILQDLPTVIVPIIRLLPHAYSLQPMKKRNISGKKAETAETKSHMSCKHQLFNTLMPWIYIKI